MSRPLRFNLVDISQYITQLGINRQPVFFDDQDYSFYLECLYDASQKWRCHVHAYALLPNRIHILITPKMENGVSRCMQSVNRRYVLHVNTKYNRRGTLWSGRYLSSLVQEQLVLDCYRHIEMSPVFASLVNEPGEYRWSSFNAHADGVVSYLLEDHQNYKYMADCERKRKIIYALNFEENGKKIEMNLIRRAVRYGHVIGDETFSKSIKERGIQAKTRNKRRRPKKTIQDYEYKVTE